MPRPILMPKFGMDQSESTIVEWLKHEGDAVEKGEPVANVMTDKVDMEVESPANGTLLRIVAPANATVPVTSVIAYICEPNEKAEAEDQADKAAGARENGQPTPTVLSTTDLPPQPATPAHHSPTPLAARIAADNGVDITAVEGTGSQGRVTRDDVVRLLNGSAAGARPRATPAARRVAREENLELAGVSGTGPRGRVQVKDVHAAIEAAALPPAAPVPASEAPASASTPPSAPLSRPTAYDAVQLTGVRRLIARRMQQSVQTIPAFTLSADIDATAVQAARREINGWLGQKGQEPVSITAVLLKAVAWTLAQHPWLNAHCQEDEVRLFREVDLGVAVAREQGLIVPVIRNAHRKGLGAIAAELHDLTARAHADRLTADDVQGGTFTVSNLGMFAVDHFTAIINPPQVGILALGRITEKLTPINGQPTIRPMLTATLSCDHRVVDGALGARFLSDFAAALAAPGLLLI